MSTLNSLTIYYLQEANIKWVKESKTKCSQIMLNLIVLLTIVTNMYLYINVAKSGVTSQNISFYIMTGALIVNLIAILII